MRKAYPAAAAPKRKTAAASVDPRSLDAATCREKAATAAVAREDSVRPRRPRRRLERHRIEYSSRWKMIHFYGTWRKGIR